uniref:MarR family transcriptional regulator n=1 Tax=Streptomyces sp. NBC_00049 TaxID=2903617 RepID=A0AAU2K405_9ACTN
MVDQGEAGVNGSVPEVRLVGETGLSNAAITKIIDRPAALGYVERARDPGDRHRFTFAD